MHILGIIGGIASGKSAVTHRLGQLGAEVLDADKAAHEVLQQKEIRQALVDQWGSAILDSQGKIDRAAIADLIFSGISANPESITQQRQFLENLIHPVIYRQFMERIVAFQSAHQLQQTQRFQQTQQFQGIIEQEIEPENGPQEHSSTVVALDAPLLVEAGWETMCNDIIFVDCPKEIRKTRAIQRGWTAEQFEEREASQMPIEDKRKHATIQIDNRTTREKLMAKVERLWLTRWAKN